VAQIDYSERIPNNVRLSDNRRLQRALEAWQPKFMRWWHEMGPVGFDRDDVYLRTAITTDIKRDSAWGYVKLPDYRWGIFLLDPDPDRRISHGEFRGQPVWQEVPGEFRNPLRRLIVVQGDTEPASVEQQRHLGRTCPSLYDLRNIFQVNVEEGRHLWAMVYLLDAYFGRDGREEAEALLARHSGDSDKPRILGAFNEPTPDWLSFFMFTFFTDRDGKFQLASLAESAFDPLSRTVRFMLREESHHMFIGTTGIARTIQRTCELLREHGTEDVRRFGGIDLPLVQRYMNLHYSVSLDLFGNELSTNAATYFTTGLKGRYQETKREDDHRLLDASYPVPSLDGGRLRTVEAPALNAMNESLRDDYIEDCQRGVNSWNRLIARAGVDFRLRLPHRGFNRKVGVFAGAHLAPDGRRLSEAAWRRRVGEWLPTEADREYVASLMIPVVERGKMANWIAPPATGINDKPVDYEYVRFEAGHPATAR
jgi:benzoyl-CoA 2,3-dioxygenase component B